MSWTIDYGIPAGRDKVTHERVLDATHFIHRTFAAGRIDYWRVVDGKSNRGRVGSISPVALFTLFWILVVEQSPFSDTAAADLVVNRLSPESREYLDLPDGGTVDDWIQRVKRARTVQWGTFEPFPHGRGKRMRLEQANAIFKADLAHPDYRKKQDRADEIADAFIFASLSYLDDSVKANFTKLTIDGTAVPVCDTRRGSSEKRDVSAVDYSAAWWIRTPDDHRATVGPLDSPRTNEEFKFGYEADAAIYVVPDPESPDGYRTYCSGVRLKRPGHKTAEMALSLVMAQFRRGFKPKVLVTDMGIVPKSNPKKLQNHLYDLGVDVICDYPRNERGKRGGYEGLIWVEGHPYCCCMPEPLISATIDYNDGEINEETWRKRLAMRAYYLAKPNGKPRKDGSIQFIHPTDHGRAVCADVKRESVPAFCRQKTLVVPKEHLNLKYRQSLAYHSAEWEREFRAARAANEGFFWSISCTRKEGLEDWTRRPVRGYASTYVAIAMMFASANLRKYKEDCARTEKQRADDERRRDKRLADSTQAQFYGVKSPSPDEVTREMVEEAISEPPAKSAA